MIFGPEGVLKWPRSDQGAKILEIAISKEFGPNKNVLRRNSKFHQSMPTELPLTAFKFKDPTPPRSAFIPKKLESSTKSKKQ